MASLEKPLQAEDIRLLSLDGGGIRGLSSLIILKHLMEQVNPKDPPKPCDYFQLIGGTSTGGLIALMLGRLHMSIEECIEKYTAMSSAAFTLKRANVDLVYKGKDDSTTRGKCSSESLENAFKTAAEQVEGDANAKILEPDGQCKVFVCANVKSQNQPILMRSYNADHAVKTLSLANCRIWEAARATSAAATFFSPIQIGDQEYGDGATGMNNPVEMVLNEAKKIWIDAPRNIKCIVSIGMGVPTTINFGENALDIKNALVALCTETEKTEKRFYINHPDLGVDGRYFRFNVSQGLKEMRLDEYEKAADITAATEAYIKDPLVRKTVVLFTNAIALQNALVSEPTMSTYLTWHPAKGKYVPHSDVQLLRKNRQTGGWFLNGHFKQWLQDKGSFTWLHAKAGSGKTALSSAVIDEIHKRNHKCLLFFYFKFQREERDTDILLHFKCTLLIQLLGGLATEGFPEPDPEVMNDDGRGPFKVSDAFKKLYEKYYPSTQPTAEDVDATLWKMLSQSTDTYVVIDGLDEYAERYRAQAIYFLADMAKQGAHVLVTSRNEPDIERIISNLSIKTSVIPFEIESVNHDIKTHLTGLVKAGPYSKWTEDVQDMVTDHLARHADGVFLWANLQMQSLADKTRENDIRKALAELPKGLGQTYERMLQRIEDNGEAGKAIIILKWLFCTQKPLKFNEVTELAAFDVEDGPEDGQFSVTFNPEVRYQNYQPLRRILSDLVTFSESTRKKKEENIWLAHVSVSEYLQSEEVCPAHFRLKMFDCHWFVFRCCLAFIHYYDSLETTAVSAPYPLILYVLKYTWTHAKYALQEQTGKGETKYALEAVVQPFLENDGPLFRSTLRMAGWIRKDTPPPFMFLKQYLDLLGPNSKYYSVARGVLMHDWSDGTPVAHIIAAMGAGDTLPFMLDSGVDVNTNDTQSYPQTLLHAAVLQGDYLVSNRSLWSEYCETGLGAVPEETNAVQQLIDAGCRCDVTNTAQQSPLHCAMMKQDASKMRILLPHSKATLNWQDKSGKTALFLSAGRGMEDAAALLLQCAECDVNLAVPSGKTPLMAAASKGHKSIVKLFLACTRTRWDRRDNLGRTALFWAVHGGFKETMDILLDQSYEIEDGQVDNEGWNLLICAAYMGHAALIDPLTQITKPGINAVDCHGRTALIWAAFRGNTAALQALLNQSGVDVNRKDSLGRTALSWAAFMRREESVRVLLSCANIDADCTDNYGQTWQDIAQQRGFVLSDIAMSPLTKTNLGEDASFRVQKAHPSIFQIGNAEFSHDGRRLAVCGMFGWVEIWDIQSSQIVARRKYGASLRPMTSWSPDDSSILVWTLFGNVSLLSMEDAVLLEVVKAPAVVSGCAWSPQGDWFIVTTRGNKMWQQFLDGNTLAWPKSPHLLLNPAISPDGKWLICLSYPNISYICNISTRELERKVVHESWPSSVQVSQDSRYWISMIGKSKIVLYSIESGEAIQEYTGDGAEAVRDLVSFGGLNECFVLAVDKNGFVNIWNRTTGRQVAHLKAQNSNYWVASNPVYPHMFATVGRDMEWKIWKMEF